MATYNTGLTRDASNDPLVPTPVSNQIIAEMPKASALLSLAQKVPMSSKTNRLPVMSVLPEAYFVNGDQGLKQTSTADWTNVTLVAEELAVIVPIPEAYLDDAQVPIWDQVRPRIVEAFGRKLDLAALFNTDKPSTWSEAIVNAAIAAGNFVLEGANVDLADDVAAVFTKLAADGQAISGAASAPAFNWRLRRLRSTQNEPIYTPLIAGGTSAGLYGYPLPEIMNGGWNASVASLIAGDWNKAIVGVRQDITFKMFTEGVITDGNGAVILNLMQQDSVALRAVMRVAFATANPVNPVNSNASTRYPFAILEPASS